MMVLEILKKSIYNNEKNIRWINVMGISLNECHVMGNFLEAYSGTFL